ncbi:arsenate reductase (azurin) small subunit [Colwellia sp. M166]|uniref:arsenate reductase (azurin) small subunit n=1 Tax=Colwellia sp. M166 TaxID=2583805 RepID=UPI00211EED54|nr:arsenate reductase (azurin) small subunit [Colwellia sp. M166]|tara:strand:- start:13259 stop:13849 length:591 start_codon:yes stop_codon:yes gene_type:complete
MSTINSDKLDSRDDAIEHGKCMVSRREFLVYSGVATATTMVAVSLFPGIASAREINARVTGYPRKKIATMSQLKDNKTFDFNYPDNGPNSQAMLIKAGIECGGGVGKQKDIVAFSYMCTHQGGPLMGSYKVTGEHRTVGQCPLHLSTFDIRRHGIIVSGQAYESLPQVLLEVDGDDIYAVGVMGLLFGRTDNLMLG